MKSILVVDDELGIAEALSEILGDAGYHVTVARDGRAGLERAQELAPDLILVDLMMPMMDGPAMIAAVRRDPRLVHTPVILMSAVTQRRIDGGGVQALLRKPFRIDELLEAVATLIGPPDPVHH